MTYILDTHAFIWWSLEPEKLPESVLNVIESPQNSIVLSIVSIWEMQIKIQLQKLSLPLALPELVDQQHTANNIELLDIVPAHIYALEQLAMHHRDPFDRLLIAQSLITQYTIITKDPQFENYSITPFWKSA